MFKASRRKIVAAIMSILVLLWVGTLGVIYLSSYFEMESQNRALLRAHAEMYSLSQSAVSRPPEFPVHEPGGPGFMEDSPMLQLSTFYSVALGYDGRVLEIRSDQPSLHTEEELESLSLEIMQSGRTDGKKNSLIFYKTDKGGYVLVAFMDNTIIHESVTTLFRYTLIIGGAALVLFFFISVLLAKKIVRPLEESYQKQTQFISDAGHELKTPVAIVGANAELLARELGDNRWLANIRYENERMGLLVGQLLELARTDSIAPRLELTDLSRLVSGEALPFETVAYEEGMPLRTDIAQGLFVLGSVAQLKQLVSILIDNALRHGTPGSEVFVSLRAARGTLRLAVENSGAPIPPEQCERLFDRFYRTDNVRNGEDRHYGLGLAIAKNIVTAHHGSIGVCCHDGRVEFEVLLPEVKK